MPMYEIHISMLYLKTIGCFKQGNAILTLRLRKGGPFTIRYQVMSYLSSFFSNEIENVIQELWVNQKVVD